MNHELDEIEPVPWRVDLYNVKYRHNNEEHVAAILLEIGKHNKNLIQKIISQLVDIPYRNRSGIKLKFRKLSSSTFSQEQPLVWPHWPMLSECCSEYWGLGHFSRRGRLSEHVDGAMVDWEILFRRSSGLFDLCRRSDSGLWDARLKQYGGTRLQFYHDGSPREKPRFRGNCFNCA